VKLGHFAGMTLGEAADAFGLPRRTADRHWGFARAWLADTSIDVTDARKAPVRRMWSHVYFTLI